MKGILDETEYELAQRIKKLEDATDEKLAKINLVLTNHIIHQKSFEKLCRLMIWIILLGFAFYQLLAYLFG